MVLSEWIAEEPRLVPYSALSAISGVLASPISPSPIILVRREKLWFSGLATHWIIATSRTHECSAGRQRQSENSGERCPFQTSIGQSDHLPIKTEENGNDPILPCRKASLSPIKESDELEDLERRTSLDRDSGSSCAKVARQSLIQWHISRIPGIRRLSQFVPRKLHPQCTANLDSILPH